jgi:hypothetical protein
VQFGQAWHARRQRPNRCRLTSALAMQVHAKAAESFEGEREIDGFTVAISLFQARWHNR